MNREEIVKEFVQSIIPDIEMIDGGCTSCVKEFINSVNDSLANYNLKLGMEDSKTYPFFDVIISDI